jgi:hypothetical protein
MEDGPAPGSRGGEEGHAGRGGPGRDRAATLPRGGALDSDGRGEAGAPSSMLCTRRTHRGTGPGTHLSGRVPHFSGPYPSRGVVPGSVEPAPGRPPLGPTADAPALGENDPAEALSQLSRRPSRPDWRSGGWVRPRRWPRGWRRPSRRLRVTGSLAQTLASTTRWGRRSPWPGP